MNSVTVVIETLNSLFFNICFLYLSLSLLNLGFNGCSDSFYVSQSAHLGQVDMNQNLLLYVNFLHVKPQTTLPFSEA